MKRLNTIRPTEAMLVDVMAKSLPGKVYNLAAGDPNLPLCKALEESFKTVDLAATQNYGPSIGEFSLRALLWKDPDEVIVSNGAKQLIYMSLAAITHPGDSVVIIGPCWASYMRICELLGLNFSLLIGSSENNYIPEINQVTSAITEKTAAVLMNNPNNPTGVIYSDDYISALIDRIHLCNTRLILDEIYRYITDIPFHSFRGEKDVIVIDGFSKALNITGWRLGYAVAESDIIKTMSSIQSQMSGPPSTLIQKIIERSWDKLNFSTFDDYRDRIDILCSIYKFAEHRPSAGFYFYLPIDSRWNTSKELCEFLLREYSIALTPGDDYGVERTVRISVASENADSLHEILDALKFI